LAETARLRAEEERLADEKRRKEEEIKDRLKLKKFIEMQEEMERK